MGQPAEARLTVAHDTNGYRDRWTVPCTDLTGQNRRAVITLTSDRTALLVAMPSDTVRMTAEQAMEMAADLLKAALPTLPDPEETEPRQ
jgi:hypothetical protein